MGLKAYIIYNGVKYWGYDVVGAMIQKANDDRVVMNDKTVEWIGEETEKMKQSTFVPKDGDPICVIPNAKYNLEDIRKNYRIKRGCDNGTCNVFSDFPYSWCYGGSYYYVAILPKANTIVTISRWSKTENGEIMDEVRKFFPRTDRNDVIIVSSGHGVVTKCEPTWMALNCTVLHQAYRNLLEGTSKTPNIYIDSLNLNTGNPVTVDALYLVYKLGMERVTDRYADQWKEKIGIQLAALNQLDWRKCLGTIGVLINLIRYPSSSCMTAIKGRQGSCPKNIKNLLKVPMDQPFCSAEDLKLTQDFLRYVLSLQGVEFTNMTDIGNALSQTGVMETAFFRAFDNMVRLKDKEWKANEGE